MFLSQALQFIIKKQTTGFHKKSVLKNFAKFTETTSAESHFQ